MRKIVLMVLVLIPGVAGVCIFGHYALQDWAGLQAAYQEYARVLDTSTDLSKLFVAQSQQNIQRINLFADGTWTLLSAIMAAIGLHGMCMSKS